MGSDVQQRRVTFADTHGAMQRHQPYIYIIPIMAAFLCGCGALASTPKDHDEYEVWEPEETTGTEHTPHNTTASAAAEEPDYAIMGHSAVDADALWRFVCRHNPDFPHEIAEAFVTIGERYGIRGDVALCQAIVETGWFRFSDGTSVTASQHNYCGLGVTGRGKKGHAFATVEDGVRAQMQHLYAYATTEPLPAGEPLMDPRFTYVRRGIASTWHELSNRWAMNPNYGRQIMTLYHQLLQHSKKQ